jgi:hypothetical protein
VDWDIVSQKSYDYFSSYYFNIISSAINTKHRPTKHEDSNKANQQK